MFGRKKGKASERELMEDLYRLYEQKMYAAAFSILHNTEQAEDAVQDAFVKIVKYLPSIGRADSEDTKHLMLRILKTTAIDQYRRNHREAERTASEECLEDKKIAVFPMYAVEDREYLGGLLGGLPETYLEVIKLRCYYGFSARETADILGVSQDVVSKRLERARKQILQRAGDEDYEENRQGKKINGKSGRVRSGGAM